jgi:hypothetical protein
MVALASMERAQVSADRSGKENASAGRLKIARRFNAEYDAEKPNPVP